MLSSVACAAPLHRERASKVGEPIPQAVDMLGAGLTVRGVDILRDSQR
jgi:hypothetical protein